MKKFLTIFFTWLSVYFIVTGALLSFRWSGIEIILPLQTLILTAILVPTIFFILGPLAERIAQHLSEKRHIK
jgi:antibiotic biosynthesis monooxygenase (ABM) superfamily enzyme